MFPQLVFRQSLCWLRFNGQPWEFKVLFSKGTWPYGPNVVVFLVFGVPLACITVIVIFWRKKQARPKGNNGTQEDNGE